MPKIDLVESLPWNFAVDSETGEVYQVSSGLNDRGQELPDPMPMEVPVGWTRNNESLVDMVRRFVRSEYLARAAATEDFETFEEADDFSWDDNDPMEKLTPYEAIFEPPVAKQPLAAAGTPVETGKNLSGDDTGRRHFPEEKQGGVGGAVTPPPTPDKEAKPTAGRPLDFDPNVHST